LAEWVFGFKHALHGFFDAMRAELYDDNIKVLLVCPGFVRTNVSINALNEKGEALQQMDEATA
jgi:dehydrogenase/reductase SDR family protein 7B